jgi:CheY-like chemotaxis protein
VIGSSLNAAGPVFAQEAAPKVVEAMAAQAEPPEMVVLDLGMPGMDGFGCAACCLPAWLASWRH